MWYNKKGSIKTIKDMKITKPEFLIGALALITSVSIALNVYLLGKMSFLAALLGAVQ